MGERLSLMNLKTIDNGLCFLYSVHAISSFGIWKKSVRLLMTVIYKVPRSWTSLTIFEEGCVQPSSLLVMRSQKLPLH
ncbi:hypothetical protein K1719_042625 [Acacia pycnantha]|nr:hypothetical protein K1719_042625 [Acacia pycnantha]